MNKLNLDKYKGCLVGGAAGDALGYPVEFYLLDEIQLKYGEDGINEYELKGGKALISDDTQMTLFTANGILFCGTCEAVSGIKCSYSAAIWSAYKDWLTTQLGTKSGRKSSWLLNVPELHVTRAPGNTCISALGNPSGGTVVAPINDSKGCGGVMRVAPIGLYFAGKGVDAYEAAMLAAEAAALTHGHDLGYIPAAALAYMIYKIVSEDIGLEDAVTGSVEAVKKLFHDAAHLDEFIEIMDFAVKLSALDIPDTVAISQIGEGWVAEETLAIAVYCALKYKDDFSKAITAAVNHSGDSDSTGAVTGNIIGAYLGLSKIPNKFTDKLEAVGLVEEIAEDLFIAYDGGDIWKSKYIDCNYVFDISVEG